MLEEEQDGAERQLRVLLVEDDDANRELEAVLLRRLGHEVNAVADGAAALTALTAGRYDAVLMGCELPAMDGFETTAAIRSCEAEDAHIPIIGLTVDEERSRCVEAGMDDHLVKPFALEALAAVLRRATPPAAASFAGVLEPVVVEQLQMLASAGSPELLTKLQTAFARDTPVRLAALESAIASGDREAIAFNAHTLKGSAANLGASRMAAVCVAIEEASKGMHKGHLDQLVLELAQAAATAQSALARLAQPG
jgi:two-component system, sensor histidine kinase and response regulator